MNTETYCKDLMKVNGLHRALKIAERAMKGTHPSTWDDLPRGTVFSPKNHKGESGLDRKHLGNLHGFWTHCFHILNREWNKYPTHK